MCADRVEILVPDRRQDAQAHTPMLVGPRGIDVRAPVDGDVVAARREPGPELLGKVSNPPYAAGTPRVPMLPSARRSSGEYTTPNVIALRGFARFSSRCSNRMVPDWRRSTPVSARASGVRPEPSRPARPRTSPSAMSRSASAMPGAAVMPRALKNTGPSPSGAPPPGLAR